jgi:hypothetical protein
MLKDRHLFISLDSCPHGSVGNADQSLSKIAGVGTACFWSLDSAGQFRRIELKDAYYMPNYGRNLVSVKRLNDAGVETVFGSSPRLIVAAGTVFPLQEDNGLFVLKGKVRSEEAAHAVPLALWHDRLGHNNRKDVQCLESKVLGMSISDKTVELCETCETEKAKRQPIKKSSWGTRALKTLDIVHTDILGPLTEESIDGFKYAIGFVDSYSRFGTVYLMKARSECLDKFKLFVTDVGSPRTLVSDGAKEYLRHEFQGFCRERGVRREVSSPYTPEDNGKAERLWGTVVGMSRCMMKAGMDKTYWSYALKAAFHVKNFCIHSSHGKTPWELFNDSKADVSGLRVFGCTVFVFVEKEFRRKLDSTAVEGVFLGYDTHCPAYIVSFPNSSGDMRILQTRNVRFDEKQFYFGKAVTSKSGGDNLTEYSTVVDHTKRQETLDLPPDEQDVDVPADEETDEMSEEIVEQTLPELAVQGNNSD